MLVVVLVVAGATACHSSIRGGSPGRQGFAGGAPPPEQWERHTPSESGFSVAMPGQPWTTEEVSQDFDGTPIRTTVGKLMTHGNGMFGFVIIEAPGGFVRDPYAEAREAARGEKSTDDSDEVVRVEEKYAANGFLVTDRVVDVPDNEVVLYMRLFVGKTRTYGTFFGMPARSERRLEPMVDAYFRSVRLDPAQAVSPVGSGRLASDRWETIYPPEAGFSARMPGSVRGDDSEDTFAGEDVRIHRYGVRSERGTEAFEVVVTRFADDFPQGAIATARRGWQEQGYTVRTERPSHNRGYAGRSVVLAKGDEVLHVNYYRARKRLFELRVRMPEGRQDALAEVHRTFTESFRIF